MAAAQEFVAMVGDVITGPVVFFALGPEAAAFGVIEVGGALGEHPDSPVSLDAAYDVRVFHADREWHWWWDQRLRAGRWSVLDDALAETRGWSRHGTIGQRLLRGTIIETAGNWTRLHDGHSRPMWVPVTTRDANSDVAIGVVEYCSVDEPRGRGGEAHGNVGVIAERLTTLRGVS